MFSPTLEALFLRARDQHAATGRWSYLAGLALLLFHVAILTPLAKQERRLAAAETAEERLATLDAELAELEPLLEEGRAEALAAIEPGLARLVDGLRRDLARLEATHQRLTAADDDAGSIGPEGSEPAAAAPPFEIDKPDWIAAIRGAGARRYGLLAALEPVAEALIVEPRFAELNAIWKSDALGRLGGQLDAVARALPRLRERFPDVEWGALEGALTGLRGTARDLVFEPPEEPYWWASPEGSAAFELGLEPALEERLRRPPALGELLVAADQAEERLGAIAARVERELGRARHAAESRRHHRAVLGGALTSVGLDLPAVAALFPLLLGLVLAALLLRRNQRLRDLGWATRLMTKDADAPALRRWFLAELGGKLEEDETAAEAAWRGAWLRALGTLALGLAWVALAAIQARESAAVEPETWLLVSVAGAGAILIAVLHRLAVVRRVIVLLEAPAPSPPIGAEPAPEEAVGGVATPEGETPEGETPEEETEPGEKATPVIDGHTLRR